MKSRLIRWLVSFPVFMGAAFMGLLGGTGCQSHITTPSAPLPVPTNSFTITWTTTNTPSNTPTPTPGSPTNTPTHSPTNSPTPLPGSPTDTSTVTHTPTNSPTNSPSDTATDSPTKTPTSTATPTPTGIWFTPTSTYTECNTPSPTLTGTIVPTPAVQNYISGALSYTGSGSGTNIAVSGGAKVYLFPSSGTYTVGVLGPGVYQLSAYFDYQSPGGGLYYCPTCQFPWSVIPVPGMRYTNSGSCSNPVTVASFPVTVSGAAGTTVAGPNLSFDDTCSYWGIYGILSYTGTKGPVRFCRGMILQTFTDAAYTVPAPYSVGSSGSPTVGINFVTNEGPGGTGLAPLYLRAFYDANGSGIFDTGDPYLEMGPVTPTTDGVLQNVTFDDTYIK